jgi:hypothetical protein
MRGKWGCNKGGCVEERLRKRRKGSGYGRMGKWVVGKMEIVEGDSVREVQGAQRVEKGRVEGSDIMAREEDRWVRLVAGTGAVGELSERGMAR